MTKPFSHTIATIGGGFSGTLVAANLLRGATAPLSVLVIERRGPVGCGVAYRASNPGHLLNAPAKHMSAWPDERDHFVDWLRRHRGDSGVPAVVDPDDFVPRHLYARYLQQVLADARAAAAPSVNYVELHAWGRRWAAAASR